MATETTTMKELIGLYQPGSQHMVGDGFPVRNLFPSNDIDREVSVDWISGKVHSFYLYTVGDRQRSTDGVYVRVDGKSGMVDVRQRHRCSRPRDRCVSGAVVGHREGCCRQQGA